MRPVLILLGRLLLVGPLALMGAVGASAVEAAGEVVIEATALRPPVLATTAGQPVTFVNLSGRKIHIQFLGDERGHRVSQIPGEIRATFHAAGRHDYVVHFSSRREAGLRGAVEVAWDPSGDHVIPECRGLMINKGVCLER
jgi:plastocyanin